MDIEKPAIVHKYITLFSTEDAYNEAYSNFSEANWSDVGYPEDTPDNYRLSRRLSNMYHKDNPPDYKFNGINDKVVEQKEELEKDDDGNWQIVYRDVDIYPDAHRSSNYRLLDYSDNCIRKAFFLEVVWGYSGWEWVDYRRILEDETEEILAGGNLYKIKSIVTVPHIIDGDRLYHINDFLFNQNAITRIEGFDTSNLIAANRAFKRGINDDSDYPIRSWNDILECHLIDGYDANGNFSNHPFGYADPVTGESLLENLVEADGLFYNNKIYMYEGDFINSIPITIPNITHIDRLYSYGAFTDNLKFKFPNITELTNTFKAAIFTQGIIDLNQIFVDGTLDNLVTFSGTFGGSSFTYTNENNHNVTTVKLDLTSSKVPAETEIDMSRFLEVVGPRTYVSSSNPSPIIANSILNIDLDFSNKVNLSYAFANIAREKRFTYDGIQIFGNGGFETINLNINDKQAYISNLNYAFANNVLITELPVAALPNADCSDNYIYKGCTFNHAITYDFSPTQEEHDSYGQFNDSTINDTFTFSHVYYLDRAEFCGIKFPNNIGQEFPYVLQKDTNYRYVDLSNSQFTSIPSQHIYIDTIRYLTTQDKYTRTGSGVVTSSQLNPFQQCTQMDFQNEVHIHYSNIIDVSGSPREFTGSICLYMYQNTSMTTTPYIHFILYRRGDLSFELFCQNLENLVTVNFEYLSFIGTTNAYGNPVCNFKDCVNLVYLKIGTATENGFEGGLDIRGCHYEVSPGVWDTHLDIPTLEATLLSMKKGPLRIMFSAWDKLSSTTQAYCNSHFNLLQVRDSEYTPNT